MELKIKFCFYNLQIPSFYFKEHSSNKFETKIVKNIFLGPQMGKLFLAWTNEKWDFLRFSSFSAF